MSAVYVSDCHGIADTISFLLWKYRVQISTPRSANLTGFLWSPNADTGILLQIRLRPLPYPFQFLYVDHLSFTLLIPLC